MLQTVCRAPQQFFCSARALDADIAWRLIEALLQSLQNLRLRLDQCKRDTIRVLPGESRRLTVAPERSEERRISTGQRFVEPEDGPNNLPNPLPANGLPTTLDEQTINVARAPRGLRGDTRFQWEINPMPFPLEASKEFFVGAGPCFGCERASKQAGLPICGFRRGWGTFPPSAAAGGFGCFCSQGHCCVCLFGSVH